MAKRRYGWDEAKIARYFKEERGTGHGKGYLPWLKVQDVSSMGRSTRAPGSKTGREHHLLSDIETAVFHLLDWSDDVRDIREQFPLDRELTRTLAAQMGIRHPKDPDSKVDLVMTTDVVVDACVAGKDVLLPMAVKPASELQKRRVLEKLEIERRVWAQQGLALWVVTEKQYTKQRIENLLWTAEMRSLAHLDAPHPNYWPDRCRYLQIALQEMPHLTWEIVFTWLEQHRGFGAGEALTALRHLIAIKAVGMDLERPFRLSDKVAGYPVRKNVTTFRSVA